MNGFSVRGSGSVKGDIVNLLLIDVWLLCNVENYIKE